MSRRLSVHLEHELLIKLETAGLTDELAQRVIGSRKNTLAQEIVKMIAGNGAEEVATQPKVVEPASLIINLAAEPFIPQGWQVEEHQKGDTFEWDPSKVTLYLSESQQGGKTILGHELRKELKDKPVLNANVLDWLLANPQHIPTEWKGKWTFFWGTIYRRSDDDLYVRCLRWYGQQWYWHCHWLDDHWDVYYPAAVLAS